MHKFEYDFSKSESNEAKHGISFEAAQELWNDADAVKLEAGEHGEVKFMKASDLERKFDENQEDILVHFDLSTATRINHNKNKNKNKNTDHLP